VPGCAVAIGIPILDVAFKTRDTRLRVTQTSQEQLQPPARGNDSGRWRPWVCIWAVDPDGNCEAVRHGTCPESAGRSKDVDTAVDLRAGVLHFLKSRTLPPDNRPMTAHAGVTQEAHIADLSGRPFPGAASLRRGDSCLWPSRGAATASGDRTVAMRQPVRTRVPIRLLAVNAYDRTQPERRQ
jgi:hypothetical protein